MKTKELRSFCSVSQTPGRNAFTLIEMLVVILIIGILAALLLPTLAAAKAKGQGTKCISNLHQLIVGWTSYAIDNGDKISQNLSADWGGWDGNMADLGSYAPGQSKASWILGDATNNLNAGAQNPNWINLLKYGLIFPYVGNPNVYQCPANTKPDAWGVQTMRAYSMNCWMGVTSSTAWNATGQMYFTKLAQVAVLGNAKAWVLMEEDQATINDGSMCEDVTQKDMTTAYHYYVDLPGHYHVNTAGIAYADGHGALRKWTDSSILSDIPQCPLTGSTGTVTGTIPADPNSNDNAWILAQTSVLN